MATQYSVNYEDERFKNVETEKQAAIDESSKVYDNMIGEADKYYQDQINAAKDYANTQQELQQQNTDFAIEQVNQQKEQAQKDYIKEQKGAYSIGSIRRIRSLPSSSSFTGCCTFCLR